MPAVHGTTVKEREQARRKIRGQRRLTFFGAKLRDASNGTERLAHACDYAKAVGADLDENARNQLAKAVAELADRRNPR